MRDEHSGLSMVESDLKDEEDDESWFWCSVFTLVLTPSTVRGDNNCDLEKASGNIQLLMISSFFTFIYKLITKIIRTQ